MSDEIQKEVDRMLEEGGRWYGSEPGDLTEKQIMLHHLRFGPEMYEQYLVSKQWHDYDDYEELRDKLIAMSLLSGDDPWMLNTVNNSVCMESPIRIHVTAVAAEMFGCQPYKDGKTCIFCDKKV